MIACVCVDDKGGMMFNHRRQSQDSVLREDLLTMLGNGKLWLNQYSARQFAPEQQERLLVAEDFLEQAGEGELCFVEDRGLAAYEARLEGLILYRWNRTYPADQHLDLSVWERKWRLIHTEEFVGSSHERITKEIYQR